MISEQLLKVALKNNFNAEDGDYKMGQKHLAQSILHLVETNSLEAERYAKCPHCGEPAGNGEVLSRHHPAKEIRSCNNCGNKFQIIKYEKSEKI